MFVEAIPECKKVKDNHTFVEEIPECQFSLHYKVKDIRMPTFSRNVSLIDASFPKDLQDTVEAMKDDFLQQLTYKSNTSYHVKVRLCFSYFLSNVIFITAFDL